MRGRWIMGAAITAALLVPGPTAAQAAGHLPGRDHRPRRRQGAADGTRRAVGCLVNAQRARARPSAAALGAPAAPRRPGAHAAACCVRGFFAHELPGREPTLVGRVTASGYLRRCARWWLGETLAFGTARLADARGPWSPS